MRERLVQSTGPFAIRAYGRHVFGSALPSAKHSPAFGARTGRALQDCCARDDGEANEGPFTGGTALVAAHAARGAREEEYEMVSKWHFLSLELF